MISSHVPPGDLPSRLLQSCFQEKGSFAKTGRENMKRKNRQPPLLPIEVGQVWQLPDSTVHITLLGRTLIHFKRMKPGARRVAPSLISKAALEQFLIKNKAVLLQS
jgi:hypothetical protein